MNTRFKGRLRIIHIMSNCDAPHQYIYINSLHTHWPVSARYVHMLRCIQADLLRMRDTLAALATGSASRIVGNGADYWLVSAN